jgi:hypothetical protein
MNGRERVEAAFSRDGSSEFAAVLCYEELYVRDHWPELTGQPWWKARSPDLDERMEAWSEIVPAMGHDWMTLASCESRAFRQSRTLEVSPGGVDLVQEAGGQRERLREPQVGGWDLVDQGWSGHVERVATTPDEVDEMVTVPDAFDPQSYVAAGHADLAHRCLDAFGSDHYPIWHVNSPLWDCFSLWGFEALMTMTVQHPELVHHACQRFLARAVHTVREGAALGARGIWIEECLTDIISPPAYRSLSLPYVQAIAEEIRGAGMQSIYYYTGDPTERLGSLLSAGCDALALEEGKKGFVIDIAEVAEAVDGRCVLLGNLDAIGVLQRADDVTLQVEIERQLAAGRRNRGRFLMSVGSPVTPETTPTRVRRYIEMVYEADRP